MSSVDDDGGDILMSARKCESRHRYNFSNVKLNNDLSLYYIFSRIDKQYQSDEKISGYFEFNLLFLQWFAVQLLLTWKGIQTL